MHEFALPRECIIIIIMNKLNSWNKLHNNQQQQRRRPQQHRIYVNSELIGKERKIRMDGQSQVIVYSAVCTFDCSNCEFER